MTTSKLARFNHRPTKAITSIISLFFVLISLKKVAQRQLQKQKDQLGIQNATVNNTSIVVNANNPNNPTNIKLGNSTISIKVCNIFCPDWIMFFFKYTYTMIFFISH